MRTLVVGDIHGAYKALVGGGKKGTISGGDGPLGARGNLDGTTQFFHDDLPLPATFVTSLIFV